MSRAVGTSRSDALASLLSGILAMRELLWIAFTSRLFTHRQDPSEQGSQRIKVITAVYRPTHVDSKDPRHGTLTVPTQKSCQRQVHDWVRRLGRALSAIKRLTHVCMQ